VPSGPRLLYVLEYSSFFTGADPLDPLEISTAHFSLMGGVLLATWVTLAAVLLMRLDLWKTADAIAPGLALGIAVMRVGCFCAGCCYGIVTTGPFGVTFPPGSVAHLIQLSTGQIGLFDAPLPVYPTQLFEMTGALLAGALAIVLLWRRVPSGVPFLAAAAFFAAVRWAVYPIRYYPEAFSGPGWEYPALYAGVIVVLLALIVWRVRSSARTDPPSRTGGRSACGAGSSR
jgi:phosphatidylglycerol:prolipoprotein diacylglycerol transferase